MAIGGTLSAATVPIAIDPQGTSGNVPWTVLTSPSANVRSGPSTSNQLLGSVPKNQALTGTLMLVESTDEEWLQFLFNNDTAYVSRSTLIRIHPAQVAPPPAFEYGYEIANRFWGMPLTYAANDLVEVPTAYTMRESGRSYKLRSEVSGSVAIMATAGLAQGVDIRVASPYRSGSQQQSIYQSAVNNDGLSQRYSAPPGHSEHQLGVCVDFADGASTAVITDAFANTPEGIWMSKNAEAFGWIQSYRPDNIAETGYIVEAWHYRYFRNQVVNPRFEDPEIGAQWTLWSDPRGQTATASLSASSFEGPQALRFGRDDGAPFGAVLYQRVPAVAGYRYRLRSWLKRQSNYDGQVMQFGYDPAGGVDPTSSAVVWTDANDPADNTYVSVAATALNPNSTAITLFIRAGHTGTNGSGPAYYFADSVSAIQYWLVPGSTSIPVPSTATASGIQLLGGAE